MPLHRVAESQRADLHGEQRVAEFMVANRSAVCDADNSAVTGK